MPPIQPAKPDDRSNLPGSQPDCALIFCHPGIDNRIRLYRLTVRQGAGLVERQPLQLSAFFKINAALDQYPRRAAAVRPLTMVTGVEMTSAQGQAITSITSAL